MNNMCAVIFLREIGYNALHRFFETQRLDIIFPWNSSTDQNSSIHAELKKMPGCCGET